MPHNLTEVSTFTANVSVPDTGDARTAASVEVPLQALANRSLYLSDQNAARLVDVFVLKHALDGYWLGARYVASSDANAADIVIAGFSKRVIDGVIYTAQTAATITPGGSANTWRYVYGYVSSGSVVYESSTVAPDETHTFKTGDLTRVFICSYRVDGSGNVRPFIKVGNRYTYRQSATAELIGIGAFTNTSYNDKDLSPYISPISRLAKCTLKLTNGTIASGSSMKIRTKGDTANEFNMPMIGSDNSVLAQLSRDIETDSNRAIEALVVYSAGTASGDILVDGYYE